VAVLASCTNTDDQSSTVAADDPSVTTFTAASGPPTAAGSVAPSTAPADLTEQGDTAVWTIENSAVVSPIATSFVAEVSRLGCSNGVTGMVFDPLITASPSDIVVIFEVESLPPGEYTCPGNDLVSVDVDLGEPIGNRNLIDGACLEGEAVTTSFCEGGPIRWQP
jgi:hypothetical protein